jgi:hypothetical protein
MIGRFTTIHQIAFVVADIDAAMAQWNAIGVGPFFIKRRLEFASFQYYGIAQPSPIISIALAHTGSVQIEIIQQHDDLESVYKDYLTAADQSVPQHVASWCTTDECATRCTEVLNAGGECAQTCTIASTGTQLAYFSRGNAAVMFEIADLRDFRHQRRVQDIEDAARTWDGRDPVREVTR